MPVTVVALYDTHRPKSVWRKCYMAVVWWPYECTWRCCVEKLTLVILENVVCRDAVLNLASLVYWNMYLNVFLTPLATSLNELCYPYEFCFKEGTDFSCKIELGSQKTEKSPVSCFITFVWRITDGAYKYIYFNTSVCQYVWTVQQM